MTRYKTWHVGSTSWNKPLRIWAQLRRGAVRGISRAAGQFKNDPVYDEGL